MSRHTAPPGFDSNHDAIMALISFGQAIWSCAQMNALLFHAERSTRYGKESDRHSEKQAMEGVYSVQQGRWVRGPCGLSRGGWYAANAALLIDGVLKKRDRGHKGQIVEYEIDWLAVKKKIEKWTQTKAPQRVQNLDPLPTQRVQNLDAKGPEFGPFESVENKQNAISKGPEFGPYTKRLTLKSDFDSPSETVSVDKKQNGSQTGTRQTSSFSRESINLELEIASGERPRTDGPSTQILNANAKYRMPWEVVVRFLHEKAENFRARGYQFNPKTLAKAFTEDFIPWQAKNRRFIDESVQRQELALQKTADVSSIGGKKQNPDPQFGHDLVNEIRQKRKGKGAS
jgi:hypothetical protein